MLDISFQIICLDVSMLTNDNKLKCNTGIALGHSALPFQSLIRGSDQLPNWFLFD